GDFLLHGGRILHPRRRLSPPWGENSPPAEEIFSPPGWGEFSSTGEEGVETDGSPPPGEKWGRQVGRHVSPGSPPLRPPRWRQPIPPVMP
ncbi:hypothetical protein KFL_016450010, partial [Klebsormidium nitens]